MRLHKDSVMVEIMALLWRHGQLPYSSLELLDFNYEWSKDCVQKMVKEGYVGIVKATNLKSLYLKPAGQKAYLEYCGRIGVPVDCSDKPQIVYNADKARRVERVNEAALLVDMAKLHRNYLTAPEAKTILEQEAARQSDNIRYSRFAGVLFNEKGGLLLYHFGKGNLSLNVSGEKSAKSAAGRLYRRYGGKAASPRFSMLILGNSTDTALRILDYSDMLAGKSDGQKKNLQKRHFNLTEFKKVFDDILFLPVSWDTPDLLWILASPDASRLYHLPRQYRREGTHVVNLLECRLHLWPHYRKQIPDDKPVEFFCYEWQGPLIVEYFINPLDLKDCVCRRVSSEIAMQIISKKV